MSQALPQCLTGCDTLQVPRSDMLDRCIDAAELQEASLEDEPKR